MAPPAADTLRILVATDNHVGYMEKHNVRGDDSWKTFHEIMCLAKARDVDMVLLGGDLFDVANPSTKSVVNVIRSLRQNCLGDKPCEIEFLGDGTEHFAGIFNHINYEDQDINVAIPVFSIHGNHDEPTGTDFYCALDMLSETGLINYFGRVPQNDKIEVRPLLLQKGSTKLALYGLSNVRDERLFREFRGGRVKFYQPGVQKDEWFNLMVVHQNHVPRTSTGYLPEEFLPTFMDFVIWGHEHDCHTEPILNQDQDFHVLQPGSSIATQLMPGEAIDKHVGILKITNQQWDWEAIPLRTVRPFVHKEIVLANDSTTKNLAKKKNNRHELTRYLKNVIDEMIEEADEKWYELHGIDPSNAADSQDKPPQPLLRLKVDYSTKDGGNYDLENPQRITNEYIERIANHDNVLYYHQKKSQRGRKAGAVENPEDTMTEQLSLESIKVDDLVKEYLTAQTLQLFPQTGFNDGVTDFIKGDKLAIEAFAGKAMKNQKDRLMQLEDVEEIALSNAIEEYRKELEKQFAAGQGGLKGRLILKPQPAEWNEEHDGDWKEQGDAWRVTYDSDTMDVEEATPATSTRGRGRGRGAKTTATSTRKTAVAKTTAKTTSTRKPAATRGRGTKDNPFVAEDEDEESDDDLLLQNQDDSQPLFVPAISSRRGAGKKAAAPAAPAARASAARSSRQSTLNFSQATTRTARAAAQKRTVIEISEDEIEDDDSAFEPA